MDLDIVQMLAEPGQRQLAVAGGAAALGIVKRVWEVWHEAEWGGLATRARLQYDPVYRGYYIAEKKRQAKKDRLFTGVAVGGPAAVGFLSAYENANPLGWSNTVEGAADLGSAVGGYHAGRFGLALFANAVSAGWGLYKRMSSD